MTFDQAAVHILLSDLPDDQKTSLFRHLGKKADVLTGSLCPSCGDPHIEWNGATNHDCTYMCACCKHMWSPDGEI